MNGGGFFWSPLTASTMVIRAEGNRVTGGDIASKISDFRALFMTGKWYCNNRAGAIVQAAPGD
jgi:hypothetical protein